MSPKVIKTEPALGERLQKRREDLHMSREDISHEIQVPLRYIDALEENNFGVFSAKVYAVGFLKKILEVLAVEEKEVYLQEFSNEWEVQMYRSPKELRPLPENRGDYPLVTPARLGFVLGGIFLLMVLAFFGLRLTKHISKPILSIEEPKNQSVFEIPIVQVRGQTEKESQLTVNGRELKIDQNGFFNEGVELPSGLNALEFITKNRFGKEDKEVRYILVK